MKLRVAYVEEPPFYSTGPDGSARGADIELADVVFRTAGASSIQYISTSFGELLVGLGAERWDVNVPVFVTPDRSRIVTFSRPVWSLADGLVVQRGNPKDLTGYSAVAECPDARLGVIPGQVQVASARSAGVEDSQPVAFADQPAAVEGLLSGEIDAFAATALGNRAIIESHPELGGVELEGGELGAFSFRTSDIQLVSAVNRVLRDYLGSEDHRRRMARYGLGPSEVDRALASGE